jgi:MFS family permease
LQPLPIALVLLPGFLAFIVVPQPAQRVTARLGPTRTLIVSVLAAAPMAAVIPLGANAVTIGAAWLVMGVCWAAASPVEQSLIAGASGARLGGGLGLYGAARLVGAMCGPVVFGALYGAAGPGLACAVAVAVLVLGAVSVPAAVRPLRPMPAYEP